MEENGKEMLEFMFGKSIFRHKREKVAAPACFARFAMREGK